MDTIGPLPNDMGFKYIIIIIDSFTRFYLKQEVTVIATADTLWCHTYRFTAPLEIVTDFGLQFMNQFLTHFNAKSSIKHHTTIPYSKDENGSLISLVERANKEVN